MTWTSGCCLIGQVCWARLGNAVPHTLGADMAQGVLSDPHVIGPLEVLKLILW